MKTLAKWSGLVLAGTFLAAAGAPGVMAQDSEPFRLASDWVGQKLDGYGDAKVTYSGPPIKLRVSMHTPEVAGFTKFNRNSLKVLEKMSGGKLVGELRAGGVVHNVREGFSANRSGITDMSPCFTFYNPTNFPVGQALGLPGLFPNAAVMSMVAERLYPKYFAQEFERQGVYALGFVGSVRFRLFSKQPITRLEDLKGLKVRSGGGLNQQIFQALGAATVMMSSRDFYSGLQRGLIDAVYTSDAAALIFKIDDVATDHLDTNINHTQLEWCLNRRTYQKLPPDLKVVMNNWARASFQAQTQLAFLRVAEIARGKFKKQGMKFHALSDAEQKRWEEAYAGVTADYIQRAEAKGVPARQLIADIKTLVARYENMSYNELMRDAIDDPFQGFWPGAE